MTTNQHDRAESLADRGRPKPLSDEKSKEDDQSQRQDERFEGGGGDVHAFQGAEHGDRRRDNPVAIDQRGAEQPHGGSYVGASPPIVHADQGHEREDAALPVVVGSHDEEAILHRDGDQQSPEDQRQNSDRTLGRAETA